MITAAVIDALVESGVTAEQLATAMKAALSDIDAEKRARRERAAEKKRRQRSRNVPECPRDNGGQVGTEGDIGGQPPSPLLPPLLPPAPPSSPPISPQTPSSEPKGSGASAPSEGRDGDEPLDLKARIFGPALTWLAKQTEKPPDKLRSMVGKWCSQYGDNATLDAITAAHRNSPLDPIPYITAALGGKNGKADEAVSRNNQDVAAIVAARRGITLQPDLGGSA